MTKDRKKTGGRAKGTPNKATRDVRAAIAELAQNTVDDVKHWLAEIDDPAKRLDLWLRMMEYHIPKLGRIEHTGEDGGPLTIERVVFSETADPK